MLICPYPNPTFDNDVFVACLWVLLHFTRRGIGTALVERLDHDLKKRNFAKSESERHASLHSEAKSDWHPSIDWPAGSVTFYQKMGFTRIRDVKTAGMVGCVMRKTLG